MNSKERKPHPLLIGFLAAIILFAAALCTAGMTFLPLAGARLGLGAAPDRLWTPPPPEDTPEVVDDETPAATTVATSAPTSTPTPIAPTPAWGPVQTGIQAQNVSGDKANLRLTPGYQNKSPEDRLALVPAGAVVQVMAGPENVDGLTWWKIEWEGRQGWTAETSVTGTRILAPITNP